VQQQEDYILPGRIGTVFFFPKESYKILQDKEKGWGYGSGFGQSDFLWQKANQSKNSN